MVFVKPLLSNAQALPVSDQEVKPTNEIKTVIPLLDGIDIQGKEFTAGALLTQRKYQQGLSRSVSRLTRVIWT
jgi:hypothetical protein